ncbi:hypothetical protein ABZY58_11145 [Micromonospora tulbaghiae]|uniref:hypothetical protein n=1 Tax=Micromonospora tulbaghiae TaxID=479978 RepID=UPI00339FAD88
MTDTPDPIEPPDDVTDTARLLWYAEKGPLADPDSRFHGATIADVNAKIEEEGYATGLHVLEQLEKGYVNYLHGDGELADAQIASLLDALRRHGGQEANHA